MRKLYEPLEPLSKVLLTMHSQLKSGGGHCLTNIVRVNMLVDVEPSMHTSCTHGHGCQEKKVILQLTFTRDYQKSSFQGRFITLE